MAESILLTSVRAVATMVVMAMGGVVLNRKGVMTPQVSKGLSEISMSLTIPCLLFTTAIGCTQDRSKDQCVKLSALLKDGWPMLLLPGIYVGAGLLVGAAAARLGRAEDNFRRSAIAAVAFGNSTGLPVTLLAIIYSQLGKDTQVGSLNPVVFLSVYLVLYPVLQWSVGSWLLRPRTPESSSSSPGNLLPERPDSVLRLLMLPEPPIASLAPSGFEVVRARPRHGNHHSFSGPDSVRMELEETRRPGTFHMGMNSPQSPEAPMAGADPNHLLTSQEESKGTRRTKFFTVLRRVFPPPVIAALLGMAVAFAEPVRGVLVDTRDRNGDAPLQWLFNGMAKIGAAAVPVNMLILGNSVAKGANSSISLRTALAVAIAKMVIMPLLGLGLALVMKSVQLIPDGPDDSFYLVTMLVSATPTANNVMVMAELAGENKEGLGTCIFVQYVLCPFLLTFWLTVFVGVATSQA